MRWSGSNPGGGGREVHNRKYMGVPPFPSQQQPDLLQCLVFAGLEFVRVDLNGVDLIQKLQGSICFVFQKIRIGIVRPVAVKNKKAVC